MKGVFNRIQTGARELALEKPVNPNYCATVVRIKTVVPLDGCDNVVGTPIFGFQAIVQKGTEVGTIGLVFPVETQLSEEYCYNNNLYRHNEKNKDTDKKGYLEDNRRVRSVKFRGHRSDCLFMPLESIEWTGIDPNALKEGDEFDVLDGKEICKKYVIPHREPRNTQKKADTGFKRVEKQFMPEHYDSENFFKFVDDIDPKTEIVVTQKLHGTSIRIGNTQVRRKPSLAESLLKRLGVNIQEYEFDYVFGSRKVIKDINNPNQNHYYDTDIWTTEGKKLEGTIPENFVLYGELIGWTPEGAPIQRDYTYGVPQGLCELYIYRVAFINHRGRIVDLPWDHVKELCRELGIKHVVELYRGKLKGFDVQKFMDVRYAENGFPEAVSMGENKFVDEGICVRIDGMTPRILKAKSPLFLQHETELLDAGVEDVESSQSEV